jgi:AbiV family abortive infection protein
MNSQLQSYGGELTPADIAQGIAAAQANANRLIADARILVDAGRFPSAAALAILAIEERGKVIILKRMAIVPADKLKETWRDYRSHRAKNAAWAMPILLAEGARTMKDFAPLVDKKADHAAMLDVLKQVAFYTDCVGEKHWSNPEEVIESDLAKVLIEVAERMLGDRPVTAQEVELWREIVAPHYAKPEMAEAVIRCETALKEAGLRDTSIEGLRAFMEGRPIEVQSAEPKADGRCGAAADDAPVS